jgi:hypothetical protein
MWFGSADSLDNGTVLNRKNITDQNPVDVATRSLKVATRVRIPLGLQIGLTPFGRQHGLDPIWGSSDLSGVSPILPGRSIDRRNRSGQPGPRLDW